MFEIIFDKVYPDDQRIHDYQRVHEDNRNVQTIQLQEKGWKSPTD